MRLYRLGSLAVLLSVLAGVSSAQQSTDGGAFLSVQFYNGTVIKNVTVVGAIEIETKYGKIVVPAADIKKIDFGFRVPEEDAKALEAALMNLTSSKFQDREAAASELVQLGRVAYPALEKLAKAKQDLDTTQRITKIMEAIQKREPYDAKLKGVSDDDVIQTMQGFILRGKITTQVLKARERVLGEMSLPFAHLKTVTQPEVVPLWDRSFAKAQIILNEMGAGSKSGTVQSGTADIYAVIAPKSGVMVIRHNRAGGSTLDPYLRVYNSAKMQIAEDDDGGGNLNSLVQINVVAGQIYYIGAGGLGASSGTYELQVSMGGN
jgi:hypothetical protein